MGYYTLFVKKGGLKMKQLISKEDIKPIVYSLFVSLLAGFFVNILVLLAVMMAKDAE